jgi:hypothetical protein
MPITVNISETQLFTALRAVLLTIVNCEVVRAPVNRVAMPKLAFVSLTPISNIALSTNVTTLTGASTSIKRSSQFTIQIDCYGAGAGDRATAIAILLRSQYGCDQLAASGFDIQPLYAGDARQMPIVDGEAQYELRYSFDAVLQFNPVLTTPQDSATALRVGVFDVDRTFPP